jgi:hypothetical protein
VVFLGELGDLWPEEDDRMVETLKDDPGTSVEQGDQRKGRKTQKMKSENFHDGMNRVHWVRLKQGQLG